LTLNSPERVPATSKAHSNLTILTGRCATGKDILRCGFRVGHDKEVTDWGAATAISCKCPTWNELALCSTIPICRSAMISRFAGKSATRDERKLEGPFLGRSNSGATSVRTPKSSRTASRWTKLWGLVTACWAQEWLLKEKLNLLRFWGICWASAVREFDSHARQILFHGNTLDTLV